MKRSIFLFVFFIATNQECHSQINKIKKKVSETLFELNIPTTKFDIRKLIHGSENFKNLNEYTVGDYDMIEAEFNSNYKLSYIQNARRRMILFSFAKGTDINAGFGIELHYPSRSVESSVKQFKEFINYFKPNSYTTSLKPHIENNEKTGELFYAYSSVKSYQNRQAYLIIRSVYTVIGNEYISPPPGKYYAIFFNFYEKNLY